MSLVYKNVNADCPIQGVSSKRSLFEKEAVRPKLSTINGFRAGHRNSKRVYKNKTGPDRSPITKVKGVLEEHLKNGSSTEDDDTEHPTTNGLPSKSNLTKLDESRGSSPDIEEVFGNGTKKLSDFSDVGSISGYYNGSKKYSDSSDTSGVSSLDLHYKKYSDDSDIASIDEHFQDNKKYSESSDTSGVSSFNGSFRKYSDFSDISSIDGGSKKCSDSSIISEVSSYHHNGSKKYSDSSDTSSNLSGYYSGSIENCDEIIEECNGLIRACIEDIKKSSGEMDGILEDIHEYDDMLSSQESLEVPQNNCVIVSHTRKDTDEGAEEVTKENEVVEDVEDPIDATKVITQEIKSVNGQHADCETISDDCNGTGFNGLDESNHMDIHGAIAQNDAKLVQQLLKMGEDPDEPDWESGGLPPLLQATLNSNLDIVKILIKSGCKVNVRNSQGETALHLAAGSRAFNLQLIEVLLDANIDPNIQDNVSGHTALHILLRQISTSRSSRKGRVPLSALLAAFTLLVKRCNVNIPSHRRSTVLHRAASTCPELVEPTKILVESGANIDFQNDEKETALMLSLEGGHTRAAEVLVSRGCDLSLTNRYHETALHIAARRNSGYVADLIIAVEDCPVNAQDLDGNTPLHLAAGKGYSNIVSSLLAHPRIDPDIQNSNGCSPIHVAVESGFTQVVKLLVEHSCDLTASTLEGLSPLDLAQRVFRSRSHPEILTIIHSALGHDVI